MNGLELAKRFYLEYGKPMIEKEFGSVANRIAVGLAGEGSECLGYDDLLSTDHDFEPGFCLWITKEDEAKFGHSLSRAYEALPKEFCGFRRNPIAPVGGNRHGVMTIEDFYLRFLGTTTYPLSIRDWLYLPSSSLLCACNGAVFRDDLGVFSKIRKELQQGYPEDIRRKKIAAHSIFMVQSGLYNYQRCIKRKEFGAAQLAIFSFVRHGISTAYLLNRRYEPFYKWAYRGFDEFSCCKEIGDSLAALSQLGNQEEEVDAKIASMEEISKYFIDEFKKQGLSTRLDYDLEQHALSIVNSIQDINLRNMHIMEGVSSI